MEKPITKSDKKFVNWRWGYVIVVCKIAIMFLDAGITKSFGVLIPKIADRMNATYANIGLICSLAGTLMYFCCPMISLILKRTSRRLVALIGGAMSGVCLALSAFCSSTILVGLCLALTGVGIACVYMPFMLVVNDFFPDGFVLINTISLYGHTAGTMLLPLITEQSLEAYGYDGTFLILGGITLNLIVCAVAIREPILRNPRAGYYQDQGDGLGPSDVQDKERVGGNGLENQDASVTMEHLQTYRRQKIDQTGITGGNSSATSDAEATPCVLMTCFSIKEEDRGEQALGIETEIGIPESLLPLIDDNPNHHFDTSRNVLGEQKECSLRHESRWKSLLLKEPLFWFNLLTIFLFAYAYYSWMFFLVPHAQQLGIAESRAVFLSPIAGIGGFIGRTLFIVLVAKGVNAFYIYIVAGIPITISFLLDFIGSDYSTRAGLAFLQGLCFFAEDSLFFAVPKETLVDQDNFSFAIALVSFFFGLGASAAGYISGSLFDLTQSYTKVFIIIGIVHAIVVVQVIITTTCLRKRKNSIKGH